MVLKNPFELFMCNVYRYTMDMINTFVKIRVYVHVYRIGQTKGTKASSFHGVYSSSLYFILFPFFLKKYYSTGTCLLCLLLSKNYLFAK